MTQQHVANAHVYAVLQAVNTIANFPLPYSIGHRWLSKLGALTLYTLFLLPGFIRVGYYYYFDKRVHRSITYGPKPRNRLDLYLPENLDSPKPVVLFITGGAWIIGYKAWGSLLGMQLLEKDIIVACIDYRNFPQGTISDMIEDIAQGISFITENADNFGGDPNRLYLAGQSAGAHLAACTLVEQAIKENKINLGMLTNETPLKWKASQFKAFFGISGGYNLKKLVDHFHECGLYRTLFFSIMEGEGSLQRFSPEIQVQSLSSKARSLLPPVILFHGTSDKSIPSNASTSFSDVLKSLGAEATTRLYKDKTHTDVFLQDPLRGGHDILLVDMLSAIRAVDKESEISDVFKVCRPRLVPEVLLQLAHRISPF